MTEPAPGLRVGDDAGVRTITLDRPDKLNAMSTALFDALTAALCAASLDDDVRCVVLTGSGRAFTVGMDVAEMTTPVRIADGRHHGFVPCIEEIERFPKPLLAAVNGLAVGFGATVLTHCDVVLASSDARFQFPFAALGLAPEAGSSFTLPVRIGAQEAAVLLLTGRWLDAAEAAAAGLVWKVVAPDELVTVTLDLAREIAAMPLASLVATKKLLLASRLGAVREARARELDAFARLLGGPANRAAVEQFTRARRS